MLQKLQHNYCLQAGHALLCLVHPRPKRLSVSLLWTIQNEAAGTKFSSINERQTMKKNILAQTEALLATDVEDDHD